ncbi:MAG: hypothetical protein SFX73_19360 [Kofleriaceae bacterium]|nr:hypothetical protein [Kofleriaceae bacterium]
MPGTMPIRPLNRRLIPLKGNAGQLRTFVVLVSRVACSSTSTIWAATTQGRWPIRPDLAEAKLLLVRIVGMLSKMCR